MIRAGGAAGTSRLGKEEQGALQLSRWRERNMRTVRKIFASTGIKWSRDRDAGGLGLLPRGEGAARLQASCSVKGSQFSGSGSRLRVRECHGSPREAIRYGAGKPVPPCPVEEAHPGCAADTGCFGLPPTTHFYSVGRAVLAEDLRVEVIELG